MTLINYDKISKIDLELLNNSNKKIYEIKDELKDELKEIIITEIENLINLINDSEYILKLENSRCNIQRINTLLYYSLKNNESDLIRCIKNYYLYSSELEYAYDLFKSDIKAYKKFYLKTLNELESIKFN